MFFLISKLLVIFIHPLSWIILLLLAGLRSKDLRKKKKFFIASFTVLIIFTNPLLLDITARNWDLRPISIETLPGASCAIVLGGFVNEDDHKTGYFNSASDRLMEALKLKALGKVKYILITGGNASLLPTGFREADWTKKELNDFKIADSNILIENKSRNSIENAVFTKKVLDSVHLPPPYILITSAFHMRRSEYIFEKSGLKVTPFPCNYFAGRQPFSFSEFLPEAGVLGGWNFYIKEWIGLISYKIKH